MGITAKQQREFDKPGSASSAMKRAAELSKKNAEDAKVYENAEKNLKKLRAGKLGRIAKLKRTAKELIGGSKTYLPKKKKKKKKKVKTTRTKVVESRLSKAGLSAKEVARLRGE